MMMQIVLDVMADMLEDLGCEVICAHSGAEALDVLRRTQRISITDINMPEMDGFELIEAVRGLPEFRGTPILVLSTEFSDEKKARARSAGATGWITKPFEAEKLGAAIRRVCP